MGRKKTMKKDTTSQTEPTGDEEFWSQLQQETQSQAYRQLLENATESPHPTAELLYQYVVDQLDENTTEYVEEHLALCGICANEVLSIMRLENELSEDALADRESPLTSSSLPYEVLPSERTLVDGVAIEFWEPEWAGQFATAADIPQQEHTFSMKEGEIKVVCDWGGQHGSDPPYIWLSWEAHISTERILYARFVNPVTREIRHEACLGSDLIGEETFSSHDLGFDPCRERWSVSIVLRETTE